jgi:hypothetical protein
MGNFIYICAPSVVPLRFSGIGSADTLSDRFMSRLYKTQ